MKKLDTVLKWWLIGLTVKVKPWFEWAAALQLLWRFFPLTTAP